MKIFVTFLFFLTFISKSEIFSQEGKFLKITYDKKILSKIDTTKVSSYKNEISNLNLALARYSKEVSYQLIINNHHSLFIQNEINMDNSDYGLKKMAGYIGGTNGKFYVNIKDSIYLNKSHFAGENFLIEIEVKKWKVTNEFKIINKFKCYKAISEDIVSNPVGIFKSKVTAWFCPELPSYFGPAGYFGLPGLILELDNGKIKLRATKIELAKLQKEKVKPLKNGIKITKKGFDEFIKKKAKETFGKAFKN
jgi:GLPGLI family protein